VLKSLEGQQYPDGQIPTSLLLAVISNGFDRLHSELLKEDIPYFTELDKQISIIRDVGLLLKTHNSLTQEDIERYATRLEERLEYGLNKFYSESPGIMYAEKKELFQGNIDALKIQLQNKTHEPSL